MSKRHDQIKREWARATDPAATDILDDWPVEKIIELESEIERLSTGWQHTAAQLRSIVAFVGAKWQAVRGDTFPEAVDGELPLRAAVTEMVDEIERLRRALRIAAGELSTHDPHTEKHPQQVYDELAAEAAGGGDE